MKTAAIIIIGILLFGAGATYHRYQSFHPCDWMEQDLQQQSGLPMIVVKGRISADFLLQGVINPDSVECVLAWWKWRAAGGLKPVMESER